jgi:hypothetical protein
VGVRLTQVGRVDESVPGESGEAGSLVGAESFEAAVLWSAVDEAEQECGVAAADGWGRSAEAGELGRFEQVAAGDEGVATRWGAEEGLPGVREARFEHGSARWVRLSVHRIARAMSVSERLVGVVQPRFDPGAVGCARPAAVRGEGREVDGSVGGEASGGVDGESRGLAALLGAGDNPPAQAGPVREVDARQAKLEASSGDEVAVHRGAVLSSSRQPGTPYA